MPAFINRMIWRQEMTFLAMWLSPALCPLCFFSLFLTLVCLSVLWRPVISGHAGVFPCVTAITCGRIIFGSMSHRSGNIKHSLIPIRTLRWLKSHCFKRENYMSLDCYYTESFNISWIFSGSLSHETRVVLSCGNFLNIHVLDDAWALHSWRQCNTQSAITPSIIA